MVDVSIEEFFLRRAAHIDEERQLFATFAKLVAPSETELLSLSWDERSFEDEQSSLESDLEKVSGNIKHINAETTRKIKELNEARTAQRVRQSQIVRLASLSRPVDQDTTYFITDRHVASLRENIVDEPEPFDKKYIKIAKSGELVQLEARLAEAAAAVQRSFVALDDTLSSEKGGKSSAFVATSQRHKKAELLLSTVEKLELQNFYLVKEYLKLRLNIMTVQREEAEAREDLEKTRESYIETEAALKRQLTVGINNIKAKYDKDMKMLQHQLDRQLIAIAEKGQEVQQARERLLAHSSAAEDGLKNNVNLLASRYDKLKRRYLLEMEGYSNEVKMLRSRLNKLNIPHDEYM